MAFSLGLSLARFHSVRFHGAKIQNKNAVCKFFGNYFPFFLQMLKSSLLRELRREGYGRDDGRDQGRDKNVVFLYLCGFQVFDGRDWDIFIYMLKYFAPNYKRSAFRLSNNNLFPVKEKFIPNLGTFHSQPGNNSFPRWEYILNRQSVIKNAR